MKIRKRLLSCAVAILLAFTAVYFSVGFAAHLPPSVGRPLWKFGYRHLTLAASNGEQYGVHVQKQFGPAERINVAVYDGQERHYFTKPAGDDHRHAALQSFFHLRVNAPNGKEAARLLQQYFDECGFRGAIAETVVFAHGSPASPRLGLKKLESDLFYMLAKYRPVEGHGDLVFVSCEIAQGEEGRRYIQHLADTYGFRVTADERKVQWYFFIKWFKSFEGKPNYEIDKEHWWIATPLQSGPKRLSEAAIR